MNAEYALWANQYAAVFFIHGFLPHMVSYAKFTLIGVSGKCTSVIFIVLFLDGSVAHT